MKKDLIMLDISSRIEELLGLHFPTNRWADLERGIIASAKELNIEASVGTMAVWLENGVFAPEQLDVLANYLTVGETYFFRDQPVLDIFKLKIIPELLAERFGKNQSLRFWSSGCCTGEEPYTIAMLLCENVPEMQKWDISILATDINPRFLDKAKSGLYGNWSFRETPENLKSKYFQRIGNQYQISEEIRSMVVFKQLNLVEDSYPSINNFTMNIDVIFCRNVLMYFTNELILQVGHRFFEALNPQGWLITSAVELNDDLFPKFTKVSFDKSILYRKAHQGQMLSKIVIPQEKPVSPLRRLHVLPKKESKPLRDFPK
jgi:chemotaxis protein methyltransferase CheR